MQCFQSFILLLAWKMAIHPYISISRSMILLFQCSSWHTLAANPSKTKVKTKFLMAGYKFTWANFDSPASPNNQELQLFVLSFKKKKKKYLELTKCWSAEGTTSPSILTCQVKTDLLKATPVLCTKASCCDACHLCQLEDHFSCWEFTLAQNQI